MSDLEKRHVPKPARHVSVTLSNTLSAVTTQAFRDTLRDRHPASLPPRPSEVRGGLRVEQADEVRGSLGLSKEAMERLLGSSARTVQRRRERGEALSPSESDRLWRLLFVRERAREAFGSDESATLWLTNPHPLLGGETPVDRLDTEPGLREVEDMLTVVGETSAA